MVSEEIKAKRNKIWKDKAKAKKEEKDKVIEFVLFLVEKYDIDSIDLGI